MGRQFKCSLQIRRRDAYYVPLADEAKQQTGELGEFAADVVRQLEAEREESGRLRSEVSLLQTELARVSEALATSEFRLKESEAVIKGMETARDYARTASEKERDINSEKLSAALSAVETLESDAGSARSRLRESETLLMKSRASERSLSAELKDVTSKFKLLQANNSRLEDQLGRWERSWHEEKDRLRREFVVALAEEQQKSAVEIQKQKNRAEEANRNFRKAFLNRKTSTGRSSPCSRSTEGGE